MRDASGMIVWIEARAPSFLPRPSLCVGDIKRVHRKRTIGAFGRTGELHLLLDICVRQRARGTYCLPFLLCFENCMNGEWAERKEVLIRMIVKEGAWLCYKKGRQRHRMAKRGSSVAGLDFQHLEKLVEIDDNTFFPSSLPGVQSSLMAFTSRPTQN
ncbi:hypothetical protein Tco_1374650 [Tanacetum coccineum]